MVSILSTTFINSYKLTHHSVVALVNSTNFSKVRGPIGTTQKSHIPIELYKLNTYCPRLKYFTFDPVADFRCRAIIHAKHTGNPMTSP